MLKSGFISLKRENSNIISIIFFNYDCIHNQITATICYHLIVLYLKSELSQYLSEMEWQIVCTSQLQHARVNREKEPRRDMEESYVTFSRSFYQNQIPLHGTKTNRIISFSANFMIQDKHWRECEIRRIVVCRKLLGMSSDCYSMHLGYLPLIFHTRLLSLPK